MPSPFPHATGLGWGRVICATVGSHARPGGLAREYNALSAGQGPTGPSIEGEKAREIVAHWSELSGSGHEVTGGEDGGPGR
jgi:hypothetical protein